MEINRSIEQVIAVENNMKTPKSFQMVLTPAVTIICLLYSESWQQQFTFPKTYKDSFQFPSFGWCGSSKCKMYYEFAVRLSFVSRKRKLYKTAQNVLNQVEFRCCHSIHRISCSFCSRAEYFIAGTYLSVAYGNLCSAQTQTDRSNYSERHFLHCNWTRWSNYWNTH